MNSERVHGLAGQFNQIIRDIYETDVPSMDKVFEILNALANTAALVLAGTESDDARKFFHDCLEKSTNQLIADKARQAGGLN